MRDRVSLQQWLKQHDDQPLRFDEATLLRHAGLDLPERDYPETLAIGSAHVSLTYRFEPGHPEDGITARLPLPLLNQIDPARADWLVPGLIEEAISERLRALPKSTRRQIVPIPDTARDFVETLPFAEGRLTEVLFREGVTLVTTSNVAPDDLYRDGLQRARFLPSIDRIKNHCQVMELASPTDFRLRTLQRVPLYLHPCDDSAMQTLSDEFTELAPAQSTGQVTLTINGRNVEALGAVDDVVWFSFAELCQTERSAADYIEIAREYHTVLLSHVPQMDGTLEDSARRFVHLVDEFYDRGVKLVIAADVALDALYVGKKLTFEFQRTGSRLFEMQSRESLAQPHQPT